MLDLTMPGLTGMAVAARLQREHHSSRPLILTMHKDQGLLGEAMDLGVLGFVLKEDAASDLVRAIRAVGEGRRYYSPALSGLWAKYHENTRALGSCGDGLNRLTRSERRILKMISRDMTSKEIADEIGISVRTVGNHRANISGKLGLSGSHSLLRFAFNNKSYL